MLKIDMFVRSDDGTSGIISRTGTVSGFKMYRVCDRWFERKHLVAG